MYNESLNKHLIATYPELASASRQSSFAANKIDLSAAETKSLNKLAHIAIKGDHKSPDYQQNPIIYNQKWA